MNRQDEATPISKYLASIDRRHSLLTSGAAGLPYTPSTPGILPLTRNINFNDDTFLSDEPSLLSIPSPRSNRETLSSLVAALPERKRKRTLYMDDGEKLQQKCENLERLLRHTQVDLIDSRSTITSLQHQKSSAETAFKEKLISLENSNLETKTQLQAALEKVKNLQTKVENLEKKESDAVDSLHQQKNAHSNLVSSLQSRILKLQSENCDLKQKYDEEVQKNADIIRKLSNDLEGTERGAEKWIMECQTLKDQLTLVQSQLQKCQGELKDSQARLIKVDGAGKKYQDHLVQANDNGDVGPSDESIKRYENLYVNEQLRSKKLLVEMKKLEEENAVLRSTMSQEMILKEQISSLEMKVSYMTGELKEKVACDEERKVLQNEVKEWKKVACKLNSRCTTPVNFEAFLRQNQNQLLELKHDISSVQLELQGKNDYIKKIQTENASLREQLKLLKDQSDRLSLEAKKTSRRLVSIAKDRDSLRGLKESYEQEFEGHCSKALLERNQQLEALIEKYESLSNEDPAFAKRPCETCENYASKIQSLNAELEQARQDLTVNAANLVASRNQLESVNSDLSYRIISFGKNPSAMSIEEKLREVLAENERLKASLQMFQDNSELDGMNATIMEEKCSLEERLKALERNHEILTQAYDYETSQLQTAIERLFGYHIVLVREPHSQIRLQNMHSPNPDNVFIFQAADNDWMLLETPVLDLFRQEIETYLLKDGNIPAFLAMVTIRYAEGLREDPSSQSSATVEHHAPPPPSQGDKPRPHSPLGSEQSDRDDDDDDDEEEEEKRRHGRRKVEQGEDDARGGEEDEDYEEYGSDNDASEYSDDDSDSGGAHRRGRASGDGPARDYDQDDGDDDDDDDEVIMLD